MTLPTGATSQPNVVAPMLGAVQQPASVAFLHIIPEQDEYIKILKNPLS